MSVCRHELGVQPLTPSRQFQHWAVPLTKNRGWRTAACSSHKTHTSDTQIHNKKPRQNVEYNT